MQLQSTLRTASAARYIAQIEVFSEKDGTPGFLSLSFDHMPALDELSEKVMRHLKQAGLAALSFTKVRISRH
ncbi:MULTISPECIES: hypothetical protein [Gulbenkiania]|uniref:Uncharacterized protein n=2 Tax=Gulbenkiania TaxID=397456 RepID=A0A0K6H1J2_9NEIS|nr:MULTISPECIES: hypothetical protein [Gulbenkiania]TCW31304.1 hypothetical protein EV669_1053 [Gulbenkiania mobilis]CUA84857.1 hypothetical protein Ga0061063_2213 [Gulbenkiania indica]